MQHFIYLTEWFNNKLSLRLTSRQWRLQRRINVCRSFTSQSGGKTGRIAREIACCSWERWPEPWLGFFVFFFWCENKPNVVPSDRMTLHKTSVSEKFRGVYLLISWVFPSYSMIFCLCWTSEDYAWLWIVLSVPRKCVTVWFPHGVDRYAMAGQVDCVSGLHNCLEFSQPSSCLDEAMQT